MVLEKADVLEDEGVCASRCEVEGKGCGIEAALWRRKWRRGVLVGRGEGSQGGGKEGSVAGPGRDRRPIIYLSDFLLNAYIHVSVVGDVGERSTLR